MGFFSFTNRRRSQTVGDCPSPRQFQQRRLTATGGAPIHLEEKRPPSSNSYLLSLHGGEIARDDPERSPKLLFSGRTLEPKSSCCDFCPLATLLQCVSRPPSELQRFGELLRTFPFLVPSVTLGEEDSPKIDSRIFASRGTYFFPKFVGLLAFDFRTLFAQFGNPAQRPTPCSYTPKAYRER